MNQNESETDRLSPEQERIMDQAFAVAVAITLFISVPLWVLLETGSTAFCRIYECPINRLLEND